MENIRYCYINKEYYEKNPGLIKILDELDEVKHSLRTHLFLNISFNNMNILIPLRKKLGESKRKFGKIGFSVPSESKPQAGLDYRYIMIIDDNSYFTIDAPRISKSQLKIIEDNYKKIEREALEYIKSYIRVANKNRVDKTALFKESSLINFHKELGIVNILEALDEAAITVEPKEMNEF